MNSFLLGDLISRMFYIFDFLCNNINLWFNNDLGLHGIRYQALFLSR